MWQPQRRRWFSATAATFGQRNTMKPPKYTVIPKYPFPKLPVELRSDLPAAVQRFRIDRPDYRQQLSQSMREFTDRNREMRQDRLRKCIRDAGILVPMCLVRRRSADGQLLSAFEPGFLFTVRSQALRKHAGEVRYTFNYFLFVHSGC